MSPAARRRDRAGLTVDAVGVVHLYQREGSDIVALRGVDLHVGSGEMVALLGPSGMGKSTLLRLLAGLMRPSAGQIRLGTVDIGRATASQLQELRAREVSYVVQETGRNLLPYATAVDNVWFAQQGSRRAERRDPRALLALLGLGAITERRVADLPRGVRQQVALAAGVGASPRLLLADEPTSQLDSAASADVVRLLRSINEQLGTTIILVTHDPFVAQALPRTVTIRDGRVGAEGRDGEEFAVVDGSGTVQLPPDVAARFPPHTRLRVVPHDHGVDLRAVDPDPDPGIGE